MKKSIRVDLPSQDAPREQQRFDRIKQLLGRELPESSGVEEITLSTLAVVEALAVGLKDAGVTDVVRFLMDGELLLEDKLHEDDDLPTIVTQLLGSGRWGGAFEELWLEASHAEGGIHYDITARVLSRVRKGDEELEVNLSAALAGGEASSEGVERFVLKLGRSLAQAFGGTKWRVI
jgi:hypothetical protein